MYKYEVKIYSEKYNSSNKKSIDKYGWDYDGSKETFFSNKRTKPSLWTRCPKKHGVY